jgi:hypothetical protein
MLGPRHDPVNPLSEHFALVYAPQQRRSRFPDNCVEVVESEDAARERANPEKSLHPAVVIGPSRSSEGYQLYYLVRWF